jgi:hypothetical protein
MLRQETSFLKGRKAEREIKRRKGPEAEKEGDEMIDPMAKAGKTVDMSSPKDDPFENESRAWKGAIEPVPVELAPIGRETGSSKQRVTETRNASRVSEGNKKDRVVLSEYLSEDINDMIMPVPIEGPDDDFDPGQEFFERLTEVASTEVEPPRPAPFMFATTPEAIDFNDQLLRRFGYDLEKLYQAFPHWLRRSRFELLKQKLKGFFIFRLPLTYCNMFPLLECV